MHTQDSQQETQEKEIQPKKKKNSKGKSFLKSIFEWLVYIIIFFLIVWGTPKALTAVLGSDYPIASITSSSMWPELKEGDIVLIKGLKDKYDVKVGEIVVYQNERGFTIHRVVKLSENTITTKGDANNVEDKPVSYNDIIGKAVEFRGKAFRIPYLGKLSQVFNK